MPLIALLVCLLCALTNSNDIVLSQQGYDSPQEKKILEICVSQEELRLYDMIMKHRREHNLAEIPLSKSLSYVARQHTTDLSENNPDATGACNLHSWSDNGPWTACCYTSDHKQAQCMWSKPEELTDYKDYGFEIAAGGAGSGNREFEMTAEKAFNNWVSSSSHHAVILNRNQWEKASWGAVGISIYKEYATVWFGKSADEEGEPDHCE